MNIKPRFVLFSINDNGNPNTDRKSWVESILKPMGFKKVQGSYKGQLEESYLVLANEDSKLAAVKVLAAIFNQESILVVNEDRKAFLVFKDDSTQSIGEFVSVTALEAQDLENWTLDGINYYTCR